MACLQVSSFSVNELYYIFQGSGFTGSSFFRSSFFSVQVFQGVDFSGSGSSFRSCLFFVIVKRKQNPVSMNIKKADPRCSVRKSLLRNFAKFTGKHLHQSFFFNQVPGLRTLLKKKLRHRFFPVNFTKLL